MDIKRAEKQYESLQERLAKIRGFNDAVVGQTGMVPTDYSNVSANLAPSEVYGAENDRVNASISSVQSLDNESNSLLDFMSKLRQQDTANSFTQRELALKEAEAGATFDPATGQYKISSGANSAEKMKVEAELRKEFETRTKELGTREVIASYEKIKNVNAKTPAGQMSLIFAYMKMLDPGSTVREGEYANAENTRGVPEAVRNQYNKIVRGGRLSQKQVDEFQNEAGTIYNQYVDRQMAQNLFYDQIASAQGLDHRRVTGGVGRLQKTKVNSSQQQKEGFNLLNFFGLNNSSPVGVNTQQQQAGGQDDPLGLF